VRNSGVNVVVEGVGDHGCEYMTGGHVIVLGRTGRNFGAGMSGGVAYVLDVDGQFARRCNREMVDLETLDDADADFVQNMVMKHVAITGSTYAEGLLKDWAGLQTRLVKVMPREYKRALAEQAKAASAATVAAGALAASGEAGAVVEVAPHASGGPRG
jgi:glutamate synthase domain-containing protein 3